MTKSITLISMVLSFALVGAATEPPRYEVFVGYTYVRANQFNQNAGLGTAVGGFDMNGGSAQFIYNINKWISAVGDFGVVTKPNVGIVNASNTTAFTLAGPRFNWRRSHRFTPFGQVLFGGAYRARGTIFPGPSTLVTPQLSTTQTAFAMMAGGGLDYRINKHFSVRMPEVDYVLTRFPSLSSGSRENQSSIAASAGVIFTFGAM